MLNEGVIDLYCKLLSHEKSSVKREVCWSLSNIAVGNPNLTHHILKNNDIITKIFNLMVNDKPNIVKEACWIIMNASNSAKI